jgi:hypothetical protein
MDKQDDKPQTDWVKALEFEEQYLRQCGYQIPALYGAVKYLIERLTLHTH